MHCVNSIQRVRRHRVRAQFARLTSATSITVPITSQWRHSIRFAPNSMPMPIPIAPWQCWLNQSPPPILIQPIKSILPVQHLSHPLAACADNGSHRKLTPSYCPHPPSRPCNNVKRKGATLHDRRTPIRKEIVIRERPWPERSYSNHAQDGKSRGTETESRKNHPIKH